MSLTLPSNFENDIQSRDTNLVPVVIIGNTNSGGTYITDNIFLSISSVRIGDNDTALPLLLNIPSLKESIDIEKRNYKISNVTLNLSNAIYDGKRFTERVSTSSGSLPALGSLINKECRIFWKSPATSVFSFHDLPSASVSADHAFQIYYGVIRKYEHTDEKVTLIVEDRSQSKVHKKVPINDLGDPTGILDEYKNKPYPMVYGAVDKSPCVVGAVELAEENLITSESLNIIADYDANVQVDDATDANGDLINDPLYAFRDNYVRIISKIAGLFTYSGGTQYTASQNIITLTAEFESLGEGEVSPTNPISDNAVIGYERLTPVGDPIPFRHDASSAWANGAYHFGTHNEATDLGTGNYGKRVSGTTLEERDGNTTSWDGNSAIQIGDYGIMDPQDIWWSRVEGREKVNMGCSIRFNPMSSGNYDDNIGHLVMDAQFRWNNVAYFAGYSTLRVEVSVQNREAHHAHVTITEGGTHALTSLSEIDDPSKVDILSNVISLYESPGGGSGIAATHIELKDIYIDHYVLLDDFMKTDFYAKVVTGRVSAAPTAPQVISHIMANELDHANSVNVINEDSNYASWTYQFCQAESIDSKKLLENISSVSPYIPRFTNMGEFKFNTIPTTGGTSTHTIKENDVINFSFKRTSIDKVRTKIDFKYNFDYAKEVFDNVVVDVDNDITGIASTGYDFDYYGLPDDHSDSTEVIEDDRSKYIRDISTAEAFAKWYLAWHCNQHIIMKVRLPLKYLEIEIGDIIDFDSLLGGVAPYGIDYTASGNALSGEQEHYTTFMVTSTNKTLEWVEISATHLHNVSESFSRYGCQDPSACNYDENADTNAGCQYPAPFRECDGTCINPDPNNPGYCVEEMYCQENGLQEPDCAGVCGGKAALDDCGNCVEGNTGFYWNYDKDNCLNGQYVPRNGTCGGNCYNEQIGVEGDSDYSNPCFGCNDPEAFTYNPNVCTTGSVVVDGCSFLGSPSIAGEFPCPYTHMPNIEGALSDNYICEIAPWRCCDENGNTVDPSTGATIPCPSWAFQADFYNLPNGVPETNNHTYRIGWWTEEEHGYYGGSNLPSIQDYCSNCGGCCDGGYENEIDTPYYPVKVNNTNCRAVAEATDPTVTGIKMILSTNENLTDEDIVTHEGGGDFLGSKWIYKDGNYHDTEDAPNAWAFSDWEQQIKIEDDTGGYFITGTTLLGQLMNTESDETVYLYFYVEFDLDVAQLQSIPVGLDFQLEFSGNAGTNYNYLLNEWSLFAQYEAAGVSTNSVSLPYTGDTLPTTDAENSRSYFLAKVQLDNNWLIYNFDNVNFAVPFDYDSNDPALNSLYFRMPIKVYSDFASDDLTPMFHLYGGDTQHDNEFKIIKPTNEADINGDEQYNVLDIVALSNCVLAQNCTIGDINADGHYNVLDIVALANCVLAQTCAERLGDRGRT